MYELKPTGTQKSFYGKAAVMEMDGDAILLSYGTPIVRRSPNGTLIRLWDGWTATTGKHIKAFCGLDKKSFLALAKEA